VPALPLGGVAVSPAKKVEEALRREAEKSGSSVEELVNESEALGAPLDPRDRAELHLELCGKYLGEAEELLSKKGFAQASEKGWGAAARTWKPWRRGGQGAEEPPRAVGVRGRAGGQAG
jgi:hypothetical protein